MFGFNVYVGRPIKTAGFKNIIVRQLFSEKNYIFMLIKRSNVIMKHLQYVFLRSVRTN